MIQLRSDSLTNQIATLSENREIKVFVYWKEGDSLSAKVKIK